MYSRNANHYKKMMLNNPDTTIGLSLASQAVYASKFGFFDNKSKDYNVDVYRKIYRHLRSIYGEAPNSQDVLKEMSRTHLYMFF